MRCPQKYDSMGNPDCKPEYWARKWISPRCPELPARLGTGETLVSANEEMKKYRYELVKLQNNAIVLHIQESCAQN